MDAVAPAAYPAYHEPAKPGPSAPRPAFLREQREPGAAGHWAVSALLVSNLGALPKMSVGGGLLLSLSPIVLTTNLVVGVTIQ